MGKFPSGYYLISDRVLKPHRFYVLSLLNFRKPKILPFACKTQYLANRYIILKMDRPEVYEAIEGKQAIERGFKITGKKHSDMDKMPEKHNYPKGCNTWQRKKQHRTNTRERVRRAMGNYLKLKQFTVKYRGKRYTTHQFTIMSAYRELSRGSSMTWGHFIRYVSNKPRRVKKEMIFIKTISIITINQFNKSNHVHRINHPPNRGKVFTLERSLLSITRPKPKRLLF